MGKGYRDWSNKKFKRSLRVTRESFELIFEEISMGLIKTPTPMKPNPMLAEPKAQLVLTLYRFAHGCSLSTLEVVFGWSVSTNDQTFSHVYQKLVQRRYD